MNSKTELPASRYTILLGITFFLLLIADIASMYFSEQNWRWLTKPLLIPVLLLWFLLETKSKSSVGKKWIIFALIFSWAGDVLLMLDHAGSQFFILGLSAFLTAHVFYCLYFNKRAKSTPALFRLLVALFAGILLYILYPHLGTMLWPVILYTAIISTMLLLAIGAHNSRRTRSTQLMAIGAFFFVISDSFLAINKFHTPFVLSGLAVMSTYGLAQFLIVAGAIADAKTGDGSEAIG